MKIRQGRKVGRTLYWQRGEEPRDDDELIGVVDTPEIAAIIVAAVNSPGAEPPLEPGSYRWQQWAGSALADAAKDDGAPCSRCPQPPSGMQISLRCAEHLGVE